MARKATKENVETITMTAEEAFAKHFPLIKAALAEKEAKDAEAKTAKSAYQNALKAYKKDGGDNEAMTEGLRLSKLEPADIDRKFRGINAHLKLMGVPVGTQLGLFGDGKTIATAIEDEKLGEAGPAAARPIEVQKAQAYNEGHKAGSEGATLDRVNTYTDPDLSWEFKRGYGDAQEELASGLKPKRGRRAAPQPEGVEGHA